MTPVKHTDHYQALGISPKASPREIKESYFGWIRYFDHPEERSKPGDLQGSLTEQIEQVQEAYNMLSDPQQREAYNERLNIAPDPTETEATEAEPPPRSFGDVEVMIEKRRQAGNYLKFFGLNEKPFELTPDPKFFYLSSRHKEVLSQLVVALQENKSIIKITGETGTGKTTLCRSFLKELDAGFEFAYLFHPCADEVEMMQYISAEFGLPSQSRNKNELLYHLMRFVVQMKNEGRSVAVVVDEAQNLTPELLEELRILSNMETEKEKLLQIVLIGQPELNKTLARSALIPFQQRIGAQWELSPLNVEETHGYIQHRLNVSGGKGKVAFSRPAADLVFRASGGFPRVINRLAELGLAVALQKGVKKIDGPIIRQAQKEMEDLPAQPGNRNGWKVLAASGMVLAGLAAIVIYFQTQFSWTDPPPKNTALPQMIESTPMTLSQPGKLVPKALPKTRTLAGAGNPAKHPGLENEEPKAAKSLADQDDLVRELSTLTAGESRIEAARWVLKKWGAFGKKTAPLNLKARKILKTEHGLSVYESNVNLNRLTTLNYPALVEMDMPEGEGPRYLALMEIKGNVGVFRSNGTYEIPLTLFESLWTHKAVIPWKNFENLPGDMQSGYKGDSALWLQKQLLRLGYYKDAPAPRYGARTADAVAKFQRYYNLKDHGRFDTETQMILYNRLSAYPAPKLTGE